MDALAIYAAALSTVLAGFQIYVWIDSRRTQVRLSLGRYSNLVGVATPETMGLTVRIRNNSGHTIHLAPPGTGAMGQTARFEASASLMTACRRTFRPARLSPSTSRPGSSTPTSGNGRSLCGCASAMATSSKPSGAGQSTNAGLADLGPAVRHQGFVPNRPPR